MKKPNRRSLTWLTLILFVITSGAAQYQDDSNEIFIPVVVGGGGEVEGEESSGYYIDGQEGDDNNPGSLTAPWKTLDHAVASISTGDTVYIRGGIYRMAEVIFGPPGTGPDQLTTFKAMPGERVIFTTIDDRPPTVRVTQKYLRIEGLWFGGLYEEETRIFTGGGFENSRFGKQLINNTFFGYEELSQGAAEYLLIQGNRFVHYGGGTHHHGIYLSGEQADRFSQHTIVDKNIFVAGIGGWAIHGWHTWRSSIITRNFIGDSFMSIVADGSDHLVANNFIWNIRGGAYTPNGLQLSGENMIAINNILGEGGRIIGIDDTDTVRNNAFLGIPPQGEDPIVLTLGQESQELGVSAAEIDAAIDHLDQAFSQPVATIYADDTIEPAFETLRMTIPQGSPLYQAGEPWFPGGPFNFGPDSPAPDSIDEFWNAFLGMGLCDWDSYGQVTCP